MKRRSRASLRLRAQRATGNYAQPDSKLSRRDLDHRRAYCWIQGYDAAMRDVRESKRKPSADEMPRDIPFGDGGPASFR